MTTGGVAAEAARSQTGGWDAVLAERGRDVGPGAAAARAVCHHTHR